MVVVVGVMGTGTGSDCTVLYCTVFDLIWPYLTLFGPYLALFGPIYPLFSIKQGPKGRPWPSVS